ncbi:uncharacterized protein LOC135145691 [Zophobas morio]|uniref:uncharacterized protein LOC135145691 n=1 Tax=Zophobas morio TaxID=2755281 RepID=UPI0030835C9A
MKNKINWTGASGFSSSPTSPTWALCDNNNHTFCQILFKPDRTNFLVFDLQHEYHISGARLVGNSSQDMVYEYLLEKGDSLEGPWSLVIENACKLLGPSDYTAHSGVPQDFTNFFTTGRFFRLSLLSNFGGHFCALSQVAFYGVDTRIVTYLKEFECFHLFSTLVESGYAHLSDVWVLGYKENECQSICNNSNEDVEKLKKVINKAKETENKLTFLTFTEKGAWPSGHIQNKRLPELIIESDPGTTDKVELFFDSPVKVNGELFGELQPDVLYGGPSLVKFKNIKILNAGEFYYGIRAVKNPDILCNNSLHFIKIGTQFLGTEDLIESTADSLALFDI